MERSPLRLFMSESYVGTRLSSIAKVGEYEISTHVSAKQISTIRS